jgi:hypothetical protein
MTAFQTEARVIEITRLAGIPAQVASLRVHLEEVLHGEAFSGSPRSQQFLRYVVEKSIECEFDSLKERVIGVELFHRPPSYDTGEDAIVRVTASDVRKRLLQHYGRYGDGSEFRIDIPTGSYIPEITWTPQSPSLPNADPAAATKSSAAESPAPAPGLPAKTGLPFPAKAILVSIPFALLLLALSFWVGYHTRKTESPRTNLAVLPWSALLASGHSLQIVASDPDFATEQDITGHAISLADYADQKYVPEHSSLSPEIQAFCQKYLVGGRAADVDLPIVADIVSLAKPSGKKVSIRTARAIRVPDFRTEDDFVFLGSPIANPWLEMFYPQMDFRFRFSKGASMEYIEDMHPRKNELALYTSTGGGFNSPSTGVSFAIVALVQNPGQAGQALIIAGTTPEATDAAGRLVTNISALPEALRKCDDAQNLPLRNFEMLLRVNVMAGTPTNTDMVACHRLPSL